MTHTLHLILRCDDGDRDTRCRAYFIGPSSSSIAEVRTAAAEQKAWTFTPGVPYPHIGGTDLCKEHSTTTTATAHPARAVATSRTAARTATVTTRS